MSEEGSVDNEKVNEKENYLENKESDKENEKEDDKESEKEDDKKNDKEDDKANDKEDDKVNDKENDKINEESPYSDKDEKSNKDTNEESEIIEFSTLSKEDKIKYFNFFIANNTVFEREPLGTYIAEIDIIDEEKNKKEEELLKPNSNLRQSTFRTTKKDYDTIYSKLIKVINPSTAIKGTKMNLNVIKYMIQEIYGLKFYKDTQALFNNKDGTTESFPQFVGNFLINKFSKKETLDKKSVDFMLSLDYYSRNHKDIKIFQQFLTEEYDADDLIFYLFIRSNIEKILKTTFLEKMKENLNQNILYENEGNDDLLVPLDKCKNLSVAIFGTEKDLQKNFMKNIKQLIDTPAYDKKRKTLKANSILNMGLINYHEMRGSDGPLKEEDDEDEEEDEKTNKQKKEEEKVEEEDNKEEKPKKKLRNANKKSNKKQENTNSEINNTSSPSKNKSTKNNKMSNNTTNVQKSNNNPTTTANKTKVTKTNQNKINTNSGNKTTNNSKTTNTTYKQSPVKKMAGKTNSSSVKKNNNDVSVKNTENEGDLYDFKKILNKNRADKVKNDKEKCDFLKNIISDYFRYSVIDKYFKKMIDENPMLKMVQSKITKNLKNTKEFSIRKLNAINSLVASGDKNSFCNFMKLKEKDKANRSYFDTMKKSFNNLLKVGSLKNLNENDVNNYCKIVLEFPEFSIQVYKDLLKNCD